MERLILTDSQWDKIAPHCLGKITDRGRTGTNNRLFIEAVLWIARTESLWRGLPVEFGKWNTILKRYRDWVKASVFEKIFAAVNDDADLEYAMIDVSITDLSLCKYY